MRYCPKLVVQEVKLLMFPHVQWLFQPLPFSFKCKHDMSSLTAIDPF